MTTNTEIANSKQAVQAPLPIKNYKWPLVLAVLVILAIVSAVIVIIPTRAVNLNSNLRALEATSARYQYSADLYAAKGEADSQRALESISSRYQGLANLHAANSPVDSQRAQAATVDIKMGTLSKTIPSVGGYIAGKQELIDFLSHASRAYIFSAALPPAQAAAANESFKVILDEPWRIEKLNANTEQFINGIQERGFDTMKTSTAIVPVLCGEDERAFALTRAAQHQDVFVLPVVSPAVPPGMARLRATVTAAHEADEIEYAMNVIETAGKKIGII